MKLVNLINLVIMMYTLSMFNTGQVTLPKKWRERYDIKHFTAEETKEGFLLIKPLKRDKTVFYKNKDGFGIYCENGLDVNKIRETIKKLNKE